MFVGHTRDGRVIEGSCQVMKEHPGKDVKQYGAIPLELIQRYINFWSSSSTDLYGAEVSSNSANFFGAGLKGRAYEDRYEDHQCMNQEFTVERFTDGKLVSERVALGNAMNEVLRDEYVKVNQKGIEYWNRIAEKYDNPFRFSLPHRRFYRKIGDYAASRFDLAGNPTDERTWQQNVDAWLPSAVNKDGAASVIQSGDGDPAVVAYLVRGDSFGEDAVLSNSVRNATVTMMKAGKLMRLGKNDFSELLKQPTVEWLTPGKASILVRQGAGVIDVRLPEEFDERAIKGAVNMPLYRLREYAPELDKDKSYVCYCNTGERSAAAAFILTKLGFDAYARAGGLSGMVKQKDKKA